MPERALLAAVVLLAWRDAHSRNQKQRAAALAWLHGPGLVAACDLLDLDAGALLGRLDR